MTSAHETKEPCPLCGAMVWSRHPAQPGYRLGLSFEVLHCTGCNTSFAHPLVVDTAIYDAIYSHPEQIPGYDRYAVYARRVSEVDDPMGFLARSEDVYWSISSCVKKMGPGARILDIGSGMGYLTCALRKSGYEATGLDVSRVAVAKAIERYGPYYQEADLAEWSVSHAGVFDMVIMAELIEHVPDPAAFLGMAAKLLRPGGRLVITTPNKSYFPPWVLWETDVPPVHLWWFSENSMRLFARKSGMGITFVDFTAFNRDHPATRIPVIAAGQPSCGARLDEQNRPLSREAQNREAQSRRPWNYRLLKFKRAVARRLRGLGEGLGLASPRCQRGTLCAVLADPRPSAKPPGA